MKLYLFTADTAYGQFVKIVAGKSLTEAFELAGLPAKGWDRKDGIELTIPEEQGVVFDGGGSNG